jgi:two-component system alkaline phosphatase synthesis response regulator PhoP
MPKTILIVDDEPKIIELCRDYLVAAGFEVASAATGPQALAQARRLRPDLVVLDLMLPEMDGLDVCRELRRESAVPVIMLTARVEETDRLIGLELGADDYLTKPFSPRELVARVRTVLRRVAGAQPAAADILRAGPLVLDRSRYVAALPDREISLTPTEFEILFTLASQPGRIFSRAQLLNAARGVAFESYERAIDSHIRNLRRKLEPAGASESEPRFIITVHGVGYKFSERYAPDFRS